MTKTTWILVSDAGRARIFAREGRQVTEVESLVHMAGSLHLEARLSAPAGRRGRGDGPGSRLSGPTDPREAEAGRFARRCADRLKAGLDVHRYEELLLVAPPHFLGLVRQALDPQVAKRVAGTLGRDYTALDAGALQDRLQSQGLAPLPVIFPEALPMPAGLAR